ncbi:TPA: replication initiation protein, partial [Campylobacter lari]|nr:replication initiation protein [Campylobacter lari]EAI3914942.1 replication initiation protein [Campylobacter lari]EAJ6188699.1 replication initiation protein [Campylobacter lari]EAK0829210.1 replication initiation protein [Campylobacter lari]HEC1728234.1 replication initiation protein [Campylobacter lari]
MNEIVKYHNDFNKIKLPSFTEQEQNILCGMLTKIKESQTDDSIKFTPQELQKFSTENLTNKALGEMLIVLREKFFKADFTILIEDKERDLIGKEIVNLFQSFKLWYQSNDYEYSNLQSVEMTVNPRFKYLVNEITANFTAFELAEFIAISGKYTKTLYRLLKQYRSTGKAYFEWEEFKRIMDIPQNYLMHNIDKWILKPAIKELTKERTLFDQLRVPFENLTFEKKKVSARGRGGKVIGIKFIFKPENIKIQTIERQEKLSN